MGEGECEDVRREGGENECEDKEVGEGRGGELRCDNVVLQGCGMRTYWIGMGPTVNSKIATGKSL